MPTGTASNYFAARDELLRQVCAHIFVRLQAAPDQLATTMAKPPDRSLDLELMHQLMARVSADRAGYLALLELQLEATRRPELQAAITATVREGLEARIAFHLGAGLPGNRSTVLVLYLAMTGLMVQSLTVPGVLGDSSVTELTELTELIVRTVVPER